MKIIVDKESGYVYLSGGNGKNRRPIGKLEGHNKNKCYFTATTKNYSMHLYKYLHAFCINEDVYKLFGLQTITIPTDIGISFVITVAKLKDLQWQSNMYITNPQNPTEKQIAIPLILFDQYKDGVLHQGGCDVDAFINGINAPKSFYTNWSSRIQNQNYQLMFDFSQLDEIQE